eukprot:scaffold1599_cov115-Cylindrotheca_fusiformis.AAC.9
MTTNLTSNHAGIRSLLCLSTLMLSVSRSRSFILNQGRCSETSFPPFCKESSNTRTGLVRINSAPDFHQTRVVLHLSAESHSAAGSSPSRPSRNLSGVVQVVQLVAASWLLAILLVSWEDISMAHPMRQNQEVSYRWGTSTVKGLAFGQAQRLRLLDQEPQISHSIPSYNEIMLEHRTERIPSWQLSSISKNDVQTAVANVQRSLLFVNECKSLAKKYDWDGLSTAVRSPLLHEDLAQACNLLKDADKFLSSDARDEIGFEWASCAWRHCGALADAQEAIDELDHLIGILEPFECLFCLDVVERSLYDILAVTQAYQDSSIVIPVYQPLQRMSDVGDSGVDQFDAEYLEAMEFLKGSSGK